MVKKVKQNFSFQNKVKYRKEQHEFNMKPFHQHVMILPRI